MNHRLNRTRDAAPRCSIREVVACRKFGFDEPGLRAGFDGPLSDGPGAARPARRFAGTGVGRTRAGRVGHWLFMNGGMSPVLIVGVIAFGMIAGALYGR